MSQQQAFNSGSGSATGDVVGPASSTDNDLVVFDGTTGKLIKDTGISSISPTFSGDVTTQGNFNLPQTVPTVGKITMNGVRYLHSGGDVSNTFLGSQSGNLTNTSQGSTSVGQSALSSLTTGISNTAMGHVAMDSVTTGAMNSAFGEGAMFQSASGVTGNTAVGWHSLIICQGNYNVGVGYNVMGAGVTGQENVAVGYFALQSILSGNKNIAIGSLAGENYTGSESNNICINNVGLVGESNATRIGNELTTDFYASGVAGKTIATPSVVVLDPSTNQFGEAVGTPMVSIISDVFSILSTGPQVLTTTTADAIVFSLISVTVNATGASGDSICSLGYNSPAFDNIVSGSLSFDANDNGTINSGVITAAVVPAGSTINLNVTSVDSTATVMDVKACIILFYI